MGMLEFWVFTGSLNVHYSIKWWWGCPLYVLQYIELRWIIQTKKRQMRMTIYANIWTALNYTDQEDTDEDDYLRQYLNWAELCWCWPASGLSSRLKASRNTGCIIYRLYNQLPSLNQSAIILVRYNKASKWKEKSEFTLNWQLKIGLNVFFCRLLSNISVIFIKLTSFD